MVVEVEPPKGGGELSALATVVASLRTETASQGAAALGAMQRTRAWLLGCGQISRQKWSLTMVNFRIL